MRKNKVLLILVTIFVLLFMNTIVLYANQGVITISKIDNGNLLFHDYNENIMQNFYSEEDFENVDYPSLSDELQDKFDNEHHERIAGTGNIEMIQSGAIIDYDGELAPFEESEYKRFDIKRYINYKLISTTFSDGGYYTILKVNDNEAQLLKNAGNVDGVSCDISGEFVNNGNYIKVNYIIKNNNTNSCKLSLGTFADIQIGTADDAEVLRQPDGSGIVMTDTSTNLQFKFFGRNVDGATDIDNLWIGPYPYQTVCFFNNNEVNSFSKYDSAFAYSWQDRTVASGETQVYSVLFGVDEVSAIPIVTLNEGLERYTSENASVSGAVTDLNDNDRGKLYFNVDDGDQIYLGRYELVNHQADFEIDLSKLALEDGVYNVKVWAIDESGLISSIVEKSVVIGASTPIPEPVKNEVINNSVVENKVVDNKVADNKVNDNTSPKVENQVKNTAVDNTLSEKTLPYTGFGDRIGIALLIVLVLSRVLYKKYKKINF